MAGREENIRTRDLNEASVKDIANLPFMNEQRARLIVAHREANGPFAHIDDVDDVAGIGQKLSQIIKQHFQVSGKAEEGGATGENDNQGEGGRQRAASSGRR